MAKKSCIEKANRKKELVKQYREKREKLKKEMNNPELDFEERIILQKKLESMPLNASKVRIKNRCWLTGRPRGFHRDLGICRNQLREMALKGLIPGLRKASW